MMHKHLDVTLAHIAAGFGAVLYLNSPCRVQTTRRTDLDAIQHAGDTDTGKRSAALQG